MTSKTRGLLVGLLSLAALFGVAYLLSRFLTGLTH